MAQEFTDSCRVIAPDFRGHGRSGKHPPFNWMQFGDDIRQLVHLLDLDDIFVAGHSMGGHCAITIAGWDPDRYKALMLIDPVVLSPDDMASRKDQQRGDLPHPVVKRRNVWSSPAEMYDSFASREPFLRWERQVLRDYCEFGLLRNGEGQYVLACPPSIEANVYTDSGNVGIFDLMPNVTQPVTVIRAHRSTSPREQMDFSNSPTWPDLASRFVNGQDIHLPDLTHFIPMERPDLVVDYIRAMLSFETEGEAKVQ